MSGKFFLDTNILVYCFDPSAQEKMATARALVHSALETRRGVISFQVVQEWFNVALGKFAKTVTTEEALRFLHEVMKPLCEVFPTLDLYADALDLKGRWRYSFYDSLILASASRAGCGQLFTEDLQHDQQIGDLRIVNPFL